MNYICKFCKKEHQGLYKNKDFCSLSCARKYPLLFKDTKKLSEKLKSLPKHTIKCMKCGKEISVSIVVIKARCDDCRKRKCSICGEYHKLVKGTPCYHQKIIPTLIKYFGFKKELLGTKEALTEYERIRNQLYQDYWINNLSINELISKYHYPYKNPMNFSKIMKTLDIDRRSLSDSVVLDFLKSKRILPKVTKYHCGYHTSWEGKKFWYRSSYELDYAKELDEKKIRYEVETIRIPYLKSTDNKIHVAIPDFYLIDSNTIVEIKSTFTYDEIDMTDKFKKYLELGYNIKLIYEHIDIKISYDPLKIYAPTWEEIRSNN